MTKYVSVCSICQLCYQLSSVKVQEEKERSFQRQVHSLVYQRVFGTLTMFFIIQVSFLFFIVKWEKKTPTFFLVLFLFCYVFCKLFACCIILPMSVYSMQHARTIIYIYIWRYFHEYRFIPSSIMEICPCCQQMSPIFDFSLLKTFKVYCK